MKLNQNSAKLSKGILTGLVTILLNSISKKSEYFSNRYVQSDALVIIVTYAAYIMKITGAPQSVIDDLENKTLKNGFSIWFESRL